MRCFVTTDDVANFWLAELPFYRVYPAEITTMTRRTLEDSGLDAKTQDRCKNFFALGMVYWMFSRSLETSAEWLHNKFRSRPEIAEANIKVMRAGCG